MKLAIFVVFLGVIFFITEAKPAHDQERVELLQQKEFHELNEKGRVRRAAIRERWLWPKGVVYYSFHKDLNKAGQNLAIKAMRHWMSKTCLKFFKIRENSKRKFYAEFKYGGDCRAQIGYAKKEKQLISIGSQKKPCSLGSTIHEIGHTVGFFHEQSRPDRDRHIQVLWQNMVPGKWIKDQFKKVDKKWVDSRGHNYDYKSIMHYSPWQGAKDRKSPVMKPKKKGAKFGGRDGLSDGDIAQIKDMYKCNGKGRSELPDYVPSPGEDEEFNKETEGPKPGDEEA
ncbi:nematocyst expressed protein 6-like [Exaiptasia diaphana]|uniref:Metalloendopeptidase n=1 Tax=Exaiptasia diaphana TaxID=2652724 RepID=A0A913XC13_EXADI|nr:nematocyst expressed protein 6-like [Exaiptasia diaphana]